MFSSTSPSVTLLQRKKLATIRLLSLRKVLVVLTAARRETGPLVPAGQSFGFWRTPTCLPQCVHNAEDLVTRLRVYRITSSPTQQIEPVLVLVPEGEVR